MTDRSPTTEAQLDVGRDAVARLRRQLADLDREELQTVADEAAAIRVGDVDYGAWLMARTIKALARHLLERTAVADEVEA